MCYAYNHVMKAVTYLAAFTLGAAARDCLPYDRVSPTPTIAAQRMAALWQLCRRTGDEKKPLLVEFTGSDWCPPCIAMRKNVFSKKEFLDAAGKKFILVELDFPKGDKELKEKNDPYAEKYKIEGFPTVILFDSAGKEFDRFFASEYPKTDLFLKHLDEALAKKELD